MKNYIKKTIILTIVPLLFLACNKESMIEGYVADAESTIVSKTAVFTANSTNNVYLLDELANNVGITVSIRKTRAAAAASPVAVGDSLVTILIQNGSLNKCVGKGSACMGKFAYGGDIDTTKMIRQDVPLSFFYKHGTANYALATPYSNYYPLFNLNEDAYIGFKFTDGSYKTYFGWIELQCNQNSVTIKGYGYRAFDLPKAGK